MENRNKSQEVKDGQANITDSRTQTPNPGASATFPKPPGTEEQAAKAEVLNKVLSYTLIAPVRFYQLAISPLLGKNCRHVPSCSQYTIEAIQEWGPVKGSWMGARRISRCHPWGTHGYDPVPKKPVK